MGRREGIKEDDIRLKTFLHKGLNSLTGIPQQELRP
jgi:hypothetical protein